MDARGAEEAVAHHTSHVTRHTSHVTRHTSHVTRHTSHVTRHTSQLFDEGELGRRLPETKINKMKGK